MYEAAFKNIDDTLWKDAGCSTELDYVEQTSWVLFLKYLDDYETEKEKSAKLDGKKYQRIVTGEFAWNRWAAPKKKDGNIDHNKAHTGDDLRDFVDNKLFPHLAGFKHRANNPDTIDYKIGEIFSALRNKVNGYSLRRVIDKVDTLHFLSNDDKHELSSLYEDKIKNMGNAGRNGGEYYTPRPLIRAIVKVVNPTIGETIYDGAAGSAGFLCEAYEHIRSNSELTTRQYKKLQTETLYGWEKKSLAYVIGTMNLILHGIEAPNIIHGNTLAKNIADIQRKDRVSVILANPPFGGKEQSEIQQNFPIKTGETAYLFLQHFIKKLKAGGRCGIVIKNTFLSNTDNASIALRKQLLENCDLHTILDLPAGTFQGTGVKTVVLFFTKGESTQKTWYYQLDPGRKLGKNSPLNDNDLAEFIKKAEVRRSSENSWTINTAKIDKDTCDLTVNNPNRKEEIDQRTPAEIIAEIDALDGQARRALDNIRTLI